jgi:phytanoyl-CoA hydroxylase
MFSAAVRETYRRDGFVVPLDILTPAAVGSSTRRAMSQPTTTSTTSKTRILTPNRACGGSRRRISSIGNMRSVAPPKNRQVLQDLRGTVRRDTGKLNIKLASLGAPVEWHQDRAFYSHTNDDLAAVEAARGGGASSPANAVGKAAAARINETAA